MKKLLSLLILVGSLSMSSLAMADIAPEPDVFTDVQDGDEGYYAISWLKDEGAVGGYTDGSFKPENTINRAEFSKILSIASSSETPTASDGGEIFTDLDYNSWYNPYVQDLYSRGVISGYPDNTFRPETKINYAEAAKMICEAFSMTLAEDDGSGEWYEVYVNTLEESKPDSIESNDQFITRVEMAELIWNAHSNGSY